MVPLDEVVEFVATAMGEHPAHAIRCRFGGGRAVSRYVLLEGVPNNATVHAFSVYDSETDDYVDGGYALTLAEAKALLTRLDEAAKFGGGER